MTRQHKLLPIPEQRLTRLAEFLLPVTRQVEEPDYITSDPVAFMYKYDATEDRNLAGFLAAMMAWGRRDIVMAKVDNLLDRFGTHPADFIGNLTPVDESRLNGFRHRTFTADDIRWILRALSSIMHEYGTFERFWKSCYDFAQSQVLPYSGTASFREEDSDKLARIFLSEFHNRFFTAIPGSPVRVRKHIATPQKNGSCKRLWLFLRWTIRKNSCVDPGTMSFMPVSELMIPLDVHAGRFGRLLGLVTRRANDWKAVCELTDMLKRLDPHDPARFDYALFGLGIRNIAVPAEFIINPGTA